MADNWSIAWRVHDAQFWGVPQRRKSIALVADFGGQSAPEILFEREGVSGNPSESRETGEDATGHSEGNPNQAISFLERAGKPGGVKESSYNRSESERCQPSTTSQSSKCLNEQEKCYCLQGNGIDRADTAGCNGKGWREDESYTLNTIDRHAVCYSQDAYEACAYDGTQTSPTITANNAGGQQRMPDKGNFNGVICYGLDRASFNQGQNALYDFSIEKDKAQCIVSRGPGGVMTKQ
jgi:DNA (cytosine-5)-methyltransferase 1